MLDEEFSGSENFLFIVLNKYFDGSEILDKEFLAPKYWTKNFWLRNIGQRIFGSEILDKEFLAPRY